MKPRRLNMGMLLLAIIALSNVSFMKKNCWVRILHFTGSGAHIITVNANALGGHANHGDLYVSTYCWVGGSEFACQAAPRPQVIENSSLSRSRD